MYLKILSILMLYSSSILISASNPLVTTPYGVLSGVWDVSQNGRNFASFRGVPYAAPPIGNNRFKDPQPLKPWSGILDASKYSSICLNYQQDRNPQIDGSEDCLYLNVFTPNIYSNASLPVLIFIHGGGFLYGQGDYVPYYVLNRDIVYVVMNYRLGPLGFLSTGDTVIPGNAGLKDQSRALHWIKENIAHFGGDPHNVLLTGNSAGGASVHYHYLSPLSRGTFSKGIAWSGVAFSSWTHQYNPLEKAKRLADILGCPTNSSKHILDCLLYTQGEHIVRAHIEMLNWKFHLFSIFTPTIESADVKTAFITQDPYIATEAGDIEKLPLITSVCEEEGLYPAAAYQQDPDLYLNELNNNWEELASSIFEYTDTLPKERRHEVAAKIKQEYFEGKAVSQTTFHWLVRALSDKLFKADVGKFSQMYAQKSDQPVYMYNYAFRGNFSLTNFLARNYKDYGVSHSDDILHIFKRGDPMGTTDLLMASRVMDFIYSFAMTGVPKFEGTTWSPVLPGSSDLNYLHITSPDMAAMKKTSNFANKLFWDSIGFNENENYVSNDTT